MKKAGVIILLLAVLSLSAIGCTNSSGSEARQSDDGRIKVTFWHAMSGSAGELIAKMANDYNASQDKYFVDAIFQGSYEESLTKLKAVGGTSEAPTLMQVQEIGTKYMVNSGYIQPVQDLIDQDKFDLSQWEENILSYYQIDGKLYSLPFNTSNAILIYNKDKFKAAGLDPESPPKTFGEIREMAKKLTDNSKNEKGFALLIYGWFIEQLLANQGADFVDNGNGRDSLATKSLLNSPESLGIFQWLDDMNKDGTLGNYGRQWDDIRAAFSAGKVAMYMDSTAGIAGVMQASPFEVGTGFLPTPDGKEANGVIVGGASLWLMNSVAEEEKEAAWDFMKYVTIPAVQAEWAAGTGYFPITKAAHEEPVLKEKYELAPQFLTTVKQLQNTMIGSATRGALISVFPETRNEVATAIEKLYQGDAPQKAVDDLTAKIDKLIEEDNKVNAPK
ncbi:ABC transporter substrate-binding protein [Paenibacillus thiaminolyticus]|uniref:ABC transporter substrate-binding protein n=1 Tax=Paenibacillus thiaminolyticus TaxID=49283 RepID=A0AAP9DYY8_PANTH|nr:ABC transporter substrate-binding protein [Paenibacillus thiaminolyticus]MCY9533836.1 ABC transporter substrate-binding protein [Paenibacillus thiaminolyticus]MCY9601799.1 ABC transporter substrate-binding protein [Paenibacillus thiaminolyticus]MCY9607069.1 ABC transporter substrate-binding protein [Paenibacillus thiaminolyticus]MCY9614243.1 ABC transporter substrate-binding protein [Paenibacillus thiaminolyticus]MCY9619200.1 ABC transporter substrate-binding protein [Paenibacillus thiamino